ncbi:MAG: baseplate J/gp47 family protein [Dehalococcoidia bacterium]
MAESDDDIASITGRIDTAADTNVVLLVPKGARRMRDPAIWPHVAAHARRRGIALSVVAGRRDVRGHAGANGLPTARSIARLRRGRRRVRIGDRTLMVPSFPWRGLTTMAIAGAAVFAAVTAACYVIPSAQIVITPPSTEFTTTLRARLSPLATQADIASGVLPARNLRVITTAAFSVETTGEAEVPDAAATVVIEFTNDGEDGILVPAGTRVLDDSGIAFVTDGELTVPAGESESIDATAVEPGPTGNLEAEALRHLDGFAATLTATNPRAARGGTTRSVPGVGEDDLARVRAIADEALARVAGRALAREVEDGRVFPETTSIAILSETPLAKIGDPGEYLLVEYQVVATALALTAEDLAAHAPEIVRTRLAPGVALLPGTATARADAPAELDGGSVMLTIEARGRVANLFDAELVGDAVTGARPAQAAERLTEMLDLVEPPRITIEPSFVPWRWLPRRASRISFEFAGPPTAPDSDAASPTRTPTPTPTPTPTSARVTGPPPRVAA